MKYIVFDEYQNGSGDTFTREFDEKEKAIAEAKFQWGHLTATEKKHRIVYAMESVNPDEDAPDHFDGDYVWHCETEKKYWYAVMQDREDDDWGTGSYDLEEAKRMALAYGSESYIAVIDEGGNPVCIEEIEQKDC